MVTELQLREVVNDDEVIFFASGSFSFDDEGTFSTVLDACRKYAVNRLIFDLSELEFISSAGFGFLMIADECAKKEEIEFIVANPTGMVARNLKLMKFDQVIRILELHTADKR